MDARRRAVTAALAFSAGALLVVQCAVPSVARGSKPAKAGGGRALYAAHCAACHGTAGKGDGRAAVDFRVRPTDLTDADVAGGGEAPLRRALVHAPKPMPSFETLLTVEERRQVIAYVRSLSGAVAEGE